MLKNSHLSISSSDFTKLHISMENFPQNEIPEIKNIREKYVKILWTNICDFPSPAAVCFDIDSTVTKDEMIDQFADFFGKNVQHITNQAMNGNLTFEEALATRLAFLNPTRKEYEQIIEKYEPRFTPKVKELIIHLQKNGIPVYLVTGGFREIVERKIASKLAIPSSRIFSNRLHFDSEGKYVNFDRSQLTSKSGTKMVGKAGVCAFLKKKYGYKLLFMIGDGSTDMEARPPADFFICFGGNQIREKVRMESDWFVVNFDELLDGIRGNNTFTNCSHKRLQERCFERANSF